MRLTVLSPFSIVVTVDGSNHYLSGQTGDRLDLADQVARIALFYLPGILAAEEPEAPPAAEYEPPPAELAPEAESEPVIEPVPEPEPEPEPVAEPEPEPEVEPEVEAVTVAEPSVVEMVEVPPQIVAPPRKARTRQAAAKPTPKLKAAAKPVLKVKAVKGKAKR